ncbi:MAG: PIN domain-containing protein [bacterium]
MYLVDTNIIIFMFKGKYSIDEKIDSKGKDNCFISEISIAELKYGAEKSENPEYNKKTIEELLKEIQTVPIINCLDIYALEKVRLEKIGKRLDDFDLLIGATAIKNGFTLVTNNTEHLSRMNDIKIEDWTK